MLGFKHNAGGFGTLGTLASDAETGRGPISLHTAIGRQNESAWRAQTLTDAAHRTARMADTWTHLAHPAPQKGLGKRRERAEAVKPRLFEHSIRFQRFALGPGSSSTLLRRFERGRPEDLYDVGVTLRRGRE